MKGHQADEKMQRQLNLITGAQTRLRKKAEKERLEAEYSGKLEGAVAMAIKPVQEGASEPWWEIILFNNSADAAKRFDALRKKKPHLGQDLPAGLGLEQHRWRAPTPGVDELRMAASGENHEAQHEGQQNFIVDHMCPGRNARRKRPMHLLGMLDFAPT